MPEGMLLVGPTLRITAVAAGTETEIQCQKGNSPLIPGSSNMAYILPKSLSFFGVHFDPPRHQTFQSGGFEVKRLQSPTWDHTSCDTTTRISEDGASHHHKCLHSQRSPEVQISIGSEEQVQGRDLRTPTNADLCRHFKSGDSRTDTSLTFRNAGTSESGWNGETDSFPHFLQTLQKPLSKDNLQRQRCCLCLVLKSGPGTGVPDQESKLTPMMGSSAAWGQTGDPVLVLLSRVLQRLEPPQDQKVLVSRIPQRLGSLQDQWFWSQSCG